METIECIFCHSQVRNTNLKDMNKYASHLGKHHQIKFNVLDVIRLSRTLEKQQDSKPTPEAHKLVGSTYIQKINEDSQKKRYISSNNSTNVTKVVSSKVEGDAPLDLSKHSNDKEETIQGPSNIVFSESKNSPTELANVPSTEEINSNEGIMINFGTSGHLENQSKFPESSSNTKYMETIRQIRSHLLSLKEGEQTEHIGEDITVEDKTVENHTNNEVKNNEYVEKDKDGTNKEENIDINKNIKDQDNILISEPKDVDNNVNLNPNIQAKSNEYGENDKNVEVTEEKQINAEVKEEEHMDTNKYIDDGDDIEIIGDDITNVYESVDDDDIIIIEDNISNDSESLKVGYTQNNNYKKRNYDSTISEGRNNVSTNGPEAGLKKFKLELKKIKLESIDLSEIKSENSDLQSDGDGIPWYHGILYSCQFCKRQYLEKDCFKRHVESKHSVSYGEYQLNHKEESTEKNMHECEICGRGVIWSKFGIEHHLRSHEMSLESYYQEHKDDIEVPTFNITDETLLEKYNKQSYQHSGISKSPPIEKVETDLWYNQCRFKCALCDQVFDSRTNFGRHTKSKHNLSLSEYGKEHGKSFLHEEKHSCQIDACNTVIMWDKSSIRSHLSHEHENLSLEDYNNKYMENYVEKKNHNSKTMDNSAAWASRCLYKCSLCHVEFGGSNEFNRHLKSKHSILMKEYNDQFGKPMSHGEKHSCQIESCNASIWWDRSSLYHHLRSTHDKMSLEDYEEKYMTNYKEKTIDSNPRKMDPIEKDHVNLFDKCTFKCALCEKVLNSRSKFGRHIKSEYNLNISEYTKEHGESTLHEEKHSCQVESCNSYILWDSSSIRWHLRNAHDFMSLKDYEAKYMGNYVPKDDVEKNVDSVWLNKCIFKCGLCGQIANSRAKFGKHVKSKHNLIYSEYTKDNGKSILREEKHFCQVESCQAIMIWDKSAIRDHLSRVHDLSTKDYSNKYRDNYAEKDIPISSKSGRSSDSLKSSSTIRSKAWANKCAYKCSICNVKLIGTRTFNHHLKSNHSLLLKEYIKKFGRTMSQEEKHSCQIENCNAYIWWDWSSIYVHLRVKHDKMSLDLYEEKYMKNYEEKTTKHFDSSEKKNDSWFNKCTFKCSLCKKITNSRSKFGKHAKSKHNLTISEYTKEHGKSILHIEKHSCQVETCTSSVLWDSTSIRWHLRNSHENMSILDYELKYMDNYVPKENKNSVKKESNKNTAQKDNSRWFNKCTFKCVLCDQVMDSRAKFGRHTKCEHNLSLPEYTRSNGKSIVHEEKHSCQVEGCNTFMIWDGITIKGHLGGVHNMNREDYRVKYMDNYIPKQNNNKNSAQKETENIKNSAQKDNLRWFNKCTFKCVLCDQLMDSRAMFGKHTKTEHNLSLPEYTKSNGKSIVHEEKHSCQVEGCSTILIWDGMAIHSHLQGVHNMTRKDYMVKYMDNYVKRESPISSAWANRCSYTCSICKVKLIGSMEFNRHLKTNHSLLMKEYNKEFGKALSDGEKHSCQIESCNASIWWDRMTIYYHLRSTHEKMSLEEYEEQYMKNYKEKLNENNPSTNKTTNISNEQNKYNECQFSCNICKPGILFNSRRKAEHHMKVSHKMNLIQYKEQYGSSLAFKVTHVCHLCARVMLWDRSIIRQHLYGCHDKMPIEQYFNENIHNGAEENEWLNQILFKCKECQENKFETKNRLELWKHVKDEHKINEMEYRAVHGSIYGPEHLLTHVCQICSQRVTWENVSIKPHIELKHSMSVEEYVEKYRSSYSSRKRNSSHQTQTQSLVPDKTKEVEETSEVLAWTAGTLYKCFLCQNEIAGFYQFRKHLVDQHNSNYKTYEREYDQKVFVLFSGFHLCKICQKNIKHDDQHLRNHFKEHRLTVREYFNKYKPKAPKIAKTMKKKEEKSKVIKMKEESKQNVMNKLMETFPQLATETVIKMEVHNS